MELNKKLSATDQNRILSLKAALDLLNEVYVDLRIVNHIHQAKEHVESAIARILEDYDRVD